MSSLSSTRVTLPGEQTPELGTASLTLCLRGPCWGPAPCVPCYMHRQGNASSTWPGARLVRPCPLEPRDKWRKNSHHSPRMKFVANKPCMRASEEVILLKLTRLMLFSTMSSTKSKEQKQCLHKS